MNGPKYTTPNPTTNHAQSPAQTAEAQKPVQTAASTAMNLGGPVALEADRPSEDLLGAFASDERSPSGLRNYDNAGLRQAAKLLTDLERELVGVLKEVYPHLLSGNFYEDYDRATGMVGRIREAITAAETAKENALESRDATISAMQGREKEHRRLVEEMHAEKVALQSLNKELLAALKPCLVALDSIIERGNICKFADATGGPMGNILPLAASARVAIAKADDLVLK